MAALPCIWFMADSKLPDRFCPAIKRSLLPLFLAVFSFLAVKWSKIIAYPQRDKVTIVLVIVVALCATPAEASWTLR
jgi:hypothetical protein